MRKSKAARVAGFVASAGLTVGLIGAAGAATGAYFSDSDDASVTGTLGSILVEGEVDLELDTVLPGQTVSDFAEVKNSGTSPQDVWVQVPNGHLLAGVSEAELWIGGQKITSSNPVKVKSNVPAGGGFNLTVAVKLSPGLDNTESIPGIGSVVLNGEDADARIPADRSGTLPFKVIATQVGVDA